MAVCAQSGVRCCWFKFQTSRMYFRSLYLIPTMTQVRTVTHGLHSRLAFVPEQCFVQSWLMYLSIYVSLSPEKYCDQHLILYDKSVYEN
jgi:hypothetical protein